MTEISQQHTSFHPTMVLAQKSRPSSVVPEHGPVLRKGEKRRERERVREKRERKWGLTGSCGLYPIFALPTTNNEQPTTSPIIPHWFSLNEDKVLYLIDPVSVSIPLSQLMHFELTKRGRRKWIEESAAEELRTKWMK